MYRNHPIDPALRLQPGQEALTLAQEAEAKRFAAERIAAQLSTEPADEREAEALLTQAYALAHLSPPQYIQWVDGPLQLLYLMAARPPQIPEERIWVRVWDSVRACIEKNIPGRMWERVPNEVWESVGTTMSYRLLTRLEQEVWKALHGNGGVHDRLYDAVQRNVWVPVDEQVWDHVGHPIFESVRDSIWDESAWVSREDSEWDAAWRNAHVSVLDCVLDCVGSYKDLHQLAFNGFFAVYLASNKLPVLAHFNELVSGYWLGSRGAIIVRRPRVLARNGAGRLHSATGKCVEYPDSWGFYAWHGVRVPENVILAPDSLSRDDFLSAHNEAVRRVVLERMSERFVNERFVNELGGRVIDGGSGRTLYAVPLSGPTLAPEGIVTYLQMEDATTSRQHFLRVPSTMQTVDEAVAWTLEATDDG